MSQQSINWPGFTMICFVSLLLLTAFTLLYLSKINTSLQDINAALLWKGRTIDARLADIKEKIPSCHCIQQAAP